MQFFLTLFIKESKKKVSQDPKKYSAARQLQH